MKRAASKSKPKTASEQVDTEATRVGNVVGADPHKRTVTATVLDAQGNDPTGTVQFVLNGVSWGSPVALSNNQASITILLGPGSYTVGALFTGDPGFADSSGSLSVLVAGAPFSRGPGSATGLLAGLLGFGLVLAGAGAIVARRPSGV